MVVISVQKGRDILKKVLCISVFLLSQDGFFKILTTALRLTANKSDTAIYVARGFRAKSFVGATSKCFERIFLSCNDSQIRVGLEATGHY